MVVSAKQTKQAGQKQKVKPQGQTTLARYDVSQHEGINFADHPAILAENGLIDVTKKVISHLGSAAEITRCLQIYGPMILSGDYGRIPIPILNKNVGRHLAHAIVLAGADTTGGDEKAWVHDPALWEAKWMLLNKVDSKHWGGEGSVVAVAGW
jgi:hypothetical protein